MTTIAVYEPAAPKPPSELKVYLRLKNARDHVQLEAVDENGAHVGCGNLMKFYPDGTYAPIEAGELGGQDFRSKY